MASDDHHDASNGLPPWLLSPPETLPAPPVETSEQRLPVEALGWKDFERLCVRLARKGADIEHVQLYGVEGEAQGGIDVLVRRQGDRYDTWQCKRYQTFGAGDVNKAVDRFLEGDWVERTEDFFLCVSAPLEKKATTDAIEGRVEELRRHDVTLIPFGAERLSVELKEHPDLVKEFFGQAWHDRFSVPVDRVEETSEAPECLVLLSDSEAGASHKLASTVNAAFELLPTSLDRLGPPRFRLATEAVSSREALDETLAWLCRARVAIFDVTGFEPAVMMLLGVRSVLRRGLTIVSLGGDYAVGSDSKIPFNLRDTNLVSHSESQHSKGGREPADLLALRIARGVREVREPWYDDLGVFHAIRRLPSQRRGIVPEIEGFLVLCSFSPAHTERWKCHLRPALEHRLKVLRKGLDPRPELGVARSFELESPRVVSFAVLEYIRRAQTCVVDWTEWSPNVLFEFGVRLATAPSRHLTLSFIHCAEASVDDMDPQRRALTRMFAPIRYGGHTDWKADPAFAGPLGSIRGDGPEPLIAPDSGHVHHVLQASLDIEAQPASVAVQAGLAADADMFIRRAGKSKPVSLFAANRSLSEREEVAERERLLAIWAYLAYRFGKRKVFADPDLRQQLHSAISGLMARHYNALAKERALLKKLERLADELDE